MSVAAWIVTALALATYGVARAEDSDLRCHLSFTSKEWSVLYSSAKGEGVVFCSDGATMLVDISAKGVGLAAGRWKITDGRGVFSHVGSIDEVLGSYLAVGGEVGLARAGSARVLTKGPVSLALAAKGKGFDFGISVSRFELRRSTAVRHGAPHGRGRGTS